MLFNLKREGAALSEKILIADDEDLTRRLVVDFQRTATKWLRLPTVRALDLFDKFESDFSAVILDIMMPMLTAGRSAAASENAPICPFLCSRQEVRI